MTAAEFVDVLSKSNQDYKITVLNNLFCPERLVMVTTNNNETVIELHGDLTFRNLGIEITDDIQTILTYYETLTVKQLINVFKDNKWSGETPVYLATLTDNIILLDIENLIPNHYQKVLHIIPK